MTVPDRGMRISEDERRTAVERLRVAQSEGRLSVSEYDERLGKLYEAKTYGDVDVLFVDLPQPHRPQQMTQTWVGGVPQPVVGRVDGPAAVVHNTIITPPMPVIPPNSGAATAGLVLGILSLVGFWIPFGDILLSALAVLFSGIGLSQTRGNAMAGQGRATAGLICGLLGLIPAILVVVVLASAAVFI